MGGVAGVLLAAWSLDLIASTSLVAIPRLNQVGLNLSVLTFTLGVSLAAAFFFGLFPAAQLSRLDLNKALREEGRGLIGSAGRNRLHRLLVVSEVALAMILVITAGLLLRSFDRLLRIDPGFKVENLLTAAVVLPASRYQDNSRVLAFYGDLLNRMKNLPGVVSTAGTSGIPLTGPSGDTVFQIEGRAETDPTAPPEINSTGHFYYWQVTPDYFKTMGIGLSGGRGLLESDGPSTPLVVVINETMARSYWPGESCLGKRIQLFWTATQRGPFAEIIGVVRDVPIRRLNEEPQPQAYFPTTQGPVVAGWTSRGMILTVRTATDPMLLADAVRREVRELDSSAPVFSVRSAEQVLNETVAQRRFNLILLGVFAAVALLLAAVGIYGILANAVRMRTHEIGIRLALGAKSGAVFRQVVGHGMLLAVIGVLIGMSGAFALTRYLEGLLYEVKPTDPITFGGVATILLAVALFACFLPARRATKVDPMIALRYE
jgi:putative ABC transport system permease protein